MRMSWLFGRNNAARAPLIVALLLLANALFLRAADPSELARLRDFAFDSFQRIEPREYSTESPVRIIDIDEAALAAYGQWPWPRSTLARLVDKLTEKGVAAIAFDAVFAESDRSSISSIVRDLAVFADPETIKKLLA
jgi:adenylate cyclase